jgi:hypothetical protein
MRIPKDLGERRALYDDLIRQCLASRMERYTFYSMLRNYYLFGSQDASGCDYNKILSTVETLKSFIYAPDSARFSLHLGATAPPKEIAKVPALVHELNDQWRMGKNHLTFGMGVTWSMVFGCMIFKGLWKRGVFRSYLVEPHQFGVLREDITELSDQEAFVQCYSITKSNLESELENHPRKDEIMALVHRGMATNGEPGSDLEPGVKRLLLAQGISLTSGSGVGGSPVGGLTGSNGPVYDYTPKVDAELVDMCELYVWDDERDDYQMITLVSPNIVVYDRPQPGVPGVPCFVRLATEANLYDYFWGESFVAKLTRLQDWRTRRVDEISVILAKQANPPQSFSGYGGITEEKMQAFRSAGGLVSTAMPGAKVESMAPNMPANIFTELDNIDKMFDDQAGIGHILQGKGEPGVRSRGQADLMARLGSARPKNRAIVIEEACEDLATLGMRCIQQHSKQRFEVEGGGEQGTHLIFTSAQFTNDFEVRVDAHSASPIFVEDRKADASMLLEARAIDRETYLDMIDPPGVQLLKEKLKGIEAKEAEQQKAAMAAEGAGK